MLVYDSYNTPVPPSHWYVQSPRLRVYKHARWGFSAGRCYGTIVFHVGRLYVEIN